MNGVAYRASNQEMQDLVGGQIRIACDNFSSAWEQVQAGKIRALAIFLMDRSLHLNDSPYPPLLIGRMPDYSVHDKRAGLQPWSRRYSPRGTPHLESSRK